MISENRNNKANSQKSSPGRQRKKSKQTGKRKLKRDPDFEMLDFNPKMRASQDSDADDNKQDVIKNAHKLGIHFSPIPFSYKGGADGREV